jgi:hypothetical protein
MIHSCIDNNNIGDEGAGMIAEALKINRSITTINLGKIHRHIMILMNN